MRPLKLAFVPADDNLTGFATGLTGAGPVFTMTTTVPGDGMAHLVSLTSAANLSAITMTLAGLDADGFAQTENVTGPNATTVNSVKYYSRLNTVTVSSTLGANTLDVGWTDDIVSKTVPLSWRQEQGFQVSLSVDVTNTISYTVQHTFADIREGTPPSALKWSPHASLVNLAADADGNYAFPVVATRLLINSLTAGAAIDFYVVQGA